MHLILSGHPLGTTSISPFNNSVELWLPTRLWPTSDKYWVASKQWHNILQGVHTNWHIVGRGDVLQCGRWWECDVDQWLNHDWLILQKVGLQLKTVHLFVYFIQSIYFLWKLTIREWIFFTAISSKKFTMPSARREFALMAMEARPAVREKLIAREIHNVSRRLRATNHERAISRMRRYFFRQPLISITRPSNIDGAADIMRG